MYFKCFCVLVSRIKTFSFRKFTSICFISNCPFRVAYSNSRLVQVVAKIKLEGGKIKNVTVSCKVNSCITTVGHFTKGHKNL